MPEGYEISRDESAWQDLDEFLCEYVDGSMDPVVREVFEEYVLQNPDLAQHVECLCEARKLLTRSHCPCVLRSDFLDRLRRRVLTDSFSDRAVWMPGMYAGLAHLTAFTSALVLMSMIGVMVGALLADPDVKQDSERSERMSVLAEDRAPRYGAHFSSVFVAPEARALHVGSTDRMTPVVPRRLPLVPLWADAEWNNSRPQALASVW